MSVERRIGWRDWTLVLVTLAIWVAMLAVCIVDVQRAEGQVTIPGAAKGQVKVPLHAHTDIGNGGKIKARDLDWTSVESGFPLGGCSIPCLDDVNTWTNDNTFSGSTTSGSPAVTIYPQVDVTALFVRETSGGVAEVGVFGLNEVVKIRPGAGGADILAVDADADVLPFRVQQHSGGTANMTVWERSTGVDIAKIGPAGAGHFGADDGNALNLYNGAAIAADPQWTLSVGDLGADRTAAVRDANMGYLMGTSLAQTMSGHNLFTVGTYLTDTLSVAAPALITGVFNATGIKQFANGTYFTDSVSVTPATDVLPLRVTQHSGATADLAHFDGYEAGGLSTQAKIDYQGAGHFGSGTGTKPLVLYLGVAEDASAADVSFDVSSLTVDRVLTIPDATGSLVLGGNSATLVGNASSTLAASTASSGAAFQDNSTSTKRLRMVLSGATGNNSFTFTNATRAMNFGFRDLSGSVVTVGDDPPSVAAGNLGKVDLTAQTANITTTNLSNTPTAGLYQVEVYILTTTADVTAGTQAVTIGWTDGVGATTDAASIAAHSLAVTGRSKATYLLQVASGDITYAVTNTGGYGTSQYAIYIRVISLG